MKKLVCIALCTLLAFAAYGQSHTVKSETTVRIGGKDYYVHHVAAGDTFYSLGRTYNIADSIIIRCNPQTADGLKAGQLLKIPSATVVQPVKQPSKTFIKHKVEKGETAYSLTRNYEISLQTLIKDNPGLDPTKLQEGQVIYIRKNEVGDTSEADSHREWEQYKEKVNSVAAGYQYHMVKAGETLFGISREYGVKPSEIAAMNGLADDAPLKADEMIKVPKIVKDTVSVVVKPTPVATSFSKTNIPDIALILPINSAERSGQNFLDFYRGALLAMDDMRKAGHSANLNVYNSHKSAADVTAIVEEPGFANTDLIIGPVYAEAMEPAVKFAEQKNIPIISPLDKTTVQSDMLYQAAPDVASKYVKLDSLLKTNANIVLITSDNDDKDFADDMNQLLNGKPHTSYYYNISSDGGKVANIINWEKNNVFVVLAANEVIIDRTLAGISSAYNNAAARSGKTASINVLGTSRWTRFNTIDKNLYFKLSVNLITSYHADRTSPNVRALDARYISAYGATPSLYSYKGYDVVSMFVSALFGHGITYDEKLQSITSKPLEAPYHFVQKQHAGTHYNTEWVHVTYLPSYKILAR